MDELARRVWIDDRNAIFRRGLAGALADSAFAVVGESELFSPPPQLDGVGILVFDLEHMQRALLLPRPSTLRLVALAAAEHEAALLDAVQAGIAGFLVRPTLTPDALTGCLEAVASGAGALPPALMSRLVGGLLRGGQRAVVDTLGRREVDVLRLLARGSGTREIAVELAYSERTVKNIVHDVLVKLDCRTRAQAVGIATRRGMI